MSKIDVSIIVATFNAGKFLKTALDSVKKQSYANWECIVVDGKSSDNTIDIVRLYEKDDSRFKHISEKDKGIYDAFNKGWRMAKGEWVYYLGADDQILPDALTQFFEKKPYGEIVYGNMFYKSQNGLKHEIQKNSSFLKGNMISHQSMLMRRQLIQQMDGFSLEYKICSDFDLFQRCITAGAKITHYDIDVAVFNCCGGASEASTEFAKESYMVRKKYGNKVTALYHYVKIIIKSKIQILFASKNA